MPRRGMIIAYWGWMAALSVVFVTVRPTQVPLLAVVALSGAAAIVYGVRRFRPARASRSPMR